MLPLISPQFPAWLQFAGHAELLYLADQAALLRSCKEELLLPDDRLIDSTGHSFSLENPQQPTLSHQLPLATLITLLQAHYFAEQQSCLVKIQPATVSQAIALLAPTV